MVLVLQWFLIWHDCLGWDWFSTLNIHAGGLTLDYSTVEIQK